MQLSRCPTLANRFHAMNKAQVIAYRDFLSMVFGMKHTIKSH